MGSIGRIQPPQPKLATNPQKYGTENLVESAKTRGTLRYFFVPISDTCAQYLRVYFI